MTTGFDGTSFACPVFAGSLTIVEQKLVSLGALPVNSAGKRRLGRLQDVIYAQNGRSDVYFDILTGSNGVLPNSSVSSAGTNWDFVTGFGSVDFNALTNSLASAAVPPLTLVPNSASVYASQGVNPVGTVSTLASTDGQVYAVSSVPQTGIGQAAAVQANFQTSADLSKASAMTISVTAAAGTPITNYVYIYNYATKAYDTIYTSALSTGATSFSVTLSNWTNYINSSKQIIIVDRAVYPSRLGAPQFRLSLDKINVAISF